MSFEFKRRQRLDPVFGVHFSESLHYADKCLVLILVEQFAELLQAHPGNPSILLGALLHPGHNLTVSRSADFGRLRDNIHRRRDSHHLRDGYIRPRSHTGHAVREIHDVGFIRHRRRAELIDRRTDGLQSAFDSQFFIHVENADQFTHLTDRLLDIAAQIFRKSDLQFIGHTHETGQVFLTLDTQFPADTRHIEQFFPRRPGVDFLQLLIQFDNAFFGQIGRLLHIGHFVVETLVGIHRTAGQSFERRNDSAAAEIVGPHIVFAGRLTGRLTYLGFEPADFGQSIVILIGIPVESHHILT